MRATAVSLCGAAVLVTGLVAAVPSAAGTTAPAAPRAAHTPHHLAWKKCATKDHPTLQCASVQVPLDHDRPHGRKITLALSRIPHTAKHYRGPLLVNPGGPGGSGLAMAGFVADALPKKAAAGYDVIGFDPRGVGRSKPALNCRPGHFAPVRPASVPYTPSLEKAGVDRARAFAQACATKYADVLPFIDTVSAARDLDVIRARLGAQRISYFGYSYGTYLGAVYAKLFPDRVRRMALDSVVDPHQVWYDANLTQDHAFEARHQAFLAWTAKHHAKYRLGSDPARVQARWNAMRAALTHSPAGKKVGAAELEDTFLPGGYFDGYWPMLAEAFSAYAHGGKTAPLVRAYERLGAQDAAGENSYSVYAAVNCRDAGWPRDWARWGRDNWRVHAKSPFMAWNNAWYNAPCAFWQVPSRDPVDVSNPDLPPVLLLQATDDAATPYGGAVTMHHKLRGSSLVVEQGGGNHGVTLSGNACLDRHLARYLTSGEVPRGSAGEADAVCERLPEPKPRSAARGVRDNGPAASGGPDVTGSPGADLHGMMGSRG
ncbi:alpha/beta fold hydrolase [Streptomyces sp. p1417]|uniref:Alpha/beta fold hydrolase n=1 Tax=Streptomyces typhae TaxID=2681492 RepID=A0A6L6X0W6_9ACTN|nr:alpha/beta hydrolase [Streptomyces typhae]MVO87289.1 alpha/beta fold hydrolase [Streptomyces typhae]